MNTDTTDLPGLKSVGRVLSPEPEQFGFLRTSNDILGDGEAQRRRLDEEGYLYIKNFFDPDLILEARRSVFLNLAREGLIDDRNHDLMEGVIHPGAKGAFRPDLAWRNPAIERVVYGSEMARFYMGYFGQAVRHFDFTWMRVMGPGQGSAAHCDWVYMSRGSRRLLTCWIPYVEISLEIGGLIILEKSHLIAGERLKAYLAKDVDSYCSNRPEEKAAALAAESVAISSGALSKYPDTLPKKLGGRWLTSPEWNIGDFITFNMSLVHGSLDNQSDRIRLSTDTRWQPASEPMDGRWIGVNPVGHSAAGKRGRIC